MNSKGFMSDSGKIKCASSDDQVYSNKGKNCQWKFEVVCCFMTHSSHYLQTCPPNSKFLCNKRCDK